MRLISILFMLGKLILSLGMKNDTIIKNITDTMMYGKSIKKKESKGMFAAVYKTILCGAPIGRTIHPILAAIVCRETVNITKSILSTFFKANMANGTNMIKDTSLVMNMELKKQMKTNTKTSSLAFPILVNSFRTTISKTDKFL